MVCQEFSFPSADGRTSLHGVWWLPEGTPRAVFQISHGVSEHILRYAPLADFLTRQGCAVVGHDHLGHGGSVAPGAPRLWFGPRGSWDWVVQDLYACRRLAQHRFPGLPYVLLGHSMGSFLARSYLTRFPATVDGAVLVGTGQLTPPLLAGARLIAAAEIRRLGDRAASPVVDFLAFGAYNRRFAPNRTAFDWLSLDPANVDAYIADPLCVGKATLGLFREMLRAMAALARPENLRTMNRHTPILLLSGGQDPVGDMGAGVRRVEHALRQAGAEDVSTRLYPGMRHELLNESCRDQVFQDLWQWLTDPCRPVFSRMAPAAH